ncbi:hypothetical protein GMORB2_2467 [Geosmithia morbida]|uniref:Infection structure specific protein n=1 Tax=Geosmithia morbida TaxID=1094350 RepID=A0A9P4YPY8_9HYPO|nr:uncharacterized protein GMORB2_2467 [Geosmithia morbida]KAF4120981.1 hypothetical protein GMORB2_2467 [Geosmithia morbida]
MFAQEHRIFAVMAFVAATSASNIKARDVDDCMAAASTVIEKADGIPTPPSSLASYIAKETTWSSATDACEIPAVTGSIASGYSSYMSELSSWYVKNSEVVNSFVAACTDIPEVSEQFGGVTVPTGCDSIKWESPAVTSTSTSKTSTSASKTPTSASEAPTSASETPTSTSVTSTESGSSTAATPSPSSSGSDDSSSSSSTSSDDKPENSGTRQTGAVAAAVAMAALVAFAL